jgi:putative zinc finger/helix-turn-helix YgiT family protein
MPICPQCNQAELTVSRENHHYAESGLGNVTLRAITIRRCPGCGASFASIPRLAELHRAIALLLIRKPERLVPAEIRFLRKHLGWSGADFARKFHCSPSQVSRWESETNPTPMSNAYELLLRTLVAQGERIEDYQQHMEEIATVAEARPAVLALVLEEDGWRRAA